MKTQLCKYFCKRCGKEYELEVEKDEQKVKFYCTNQFKGKVCNSILLKIIKTCTKMPQIKQIKATGTTFSILLIYSSINVFLSVLSKI